MHTIKNHVGSFQIKSETSATVQSVIAPSEDYIEPVFDPQVINLINFSPQQFLRDGYDLLLSVFCTCTEVGHLFKSKILILFSVVFPKVKIH